MKVSEICLIFKVNYYIFECRLIWGIDWSKEFSYNEDILDISDENIGLGGK